MSDSTPFTPPVTDWATDYDIFDPQYVADPFPIWDELRERCPMAHTDRCGVARGEPRAAPRATPT